MGRRELLPRLMFRKGIPSSLGIRNLRLSVWPIRGAIARPMGGYCVGLNLCPPRLICVYAPQGCSPDAFPKSRDESNVIDFLVKSPKEGLYTVKCVQVLSKGSVQGSHGRRVYRPSPRIRLGRTGPGHATKVADGSRDPASAYFKRRSQAPAQVTILVNRGIKVSSFVVPRK